MNRSSNHPWAHRWMAAALAAAALSLGGCASTRHTTAKADEVLSQHAAAMAAPQATTTRYTSALENFGRMLDVYRAAGKGPVYVQSRNIADATGLSHPMAGAELPPDITEMVRSAVNRIGDKVVYVPFHPDYVMGHAQQGATMTLTMPNVLITGAITEFDRALSSAGRGNDIGILFGKGKGETETSGQRKAVSTISRLSVDFNLVDFKSQTMVPRMQATNSMRVMNQTFDDAFDFAIYGNGFGITSNTRYLQGRHNAIRLLVDLSVVQLLGRYTNLPYWRCLPNAQPDAVVLERIARGYQAKDATTQVKWLQQTLRDYGYPLEANGVLDARTTAAVISVAGVLKVDPPKNPLDAGFFTQVYVNIPVEPVPRAPA
jgi:hypothetical protein